MKKTKIFAMITAMTIAMGSLTACGNGEYIESMSTDEIVEDNAGVEDETVTEDTKSNKTETNKTETNKSESNKTETNKSETNKSESNKSESNKAESNKTESNKTGSNKAESNKTESNNIATTAPAATPEPVHEHTWKEHTATKQVWVPHIVIVDDYEYRVVGRTDDVFVCNCSFTTTDRNTIAEHVKNHGYAHENTQYTIHEGHDIIEEVKVGSHEEDWCYNETQTYIDYYYCDCGEKKN